MRNTIAKKAFTLIELLVVITIIGILATGATTVYTSQIAKARDASRNSDIRAVQWWVEQFYLDTSTYPKWKADFESAAVNVGNFTKLVADPRHNTTCKWSRCAYVYYVAPDSNAIVDWAYEISTAFETTKSHAKASKDHTGAWADANRLEIWTRLDLNTAKAVGTSIPNTAATNANVRVIIHDWVVYKW